MQEILNIGSEAYQKHILIFEESEIELRLRYFSVTQLWFFDVSYKDFEHNGIKLSLGTLHMRSKNMPFDFVLADNSGSGIDPFRQNDFIDGRISMYLVDADEMADIRGVTVEI